MKTDYPVKSTGQRSAVLIKSALLSLFLLASATASFAQVVAYEFTQSQGTYIPLTASATVIATPTALTSTGSVDDQVYPLEAGIIPFPFSISDTEYTGLQVYANGFVAFGAPLSNSSSPISSSTEYPAVISAMGADLHALFQLGGLTGNISYETVGTAPNREFVIQWSHFKPYNYSTTITAYFDLNFQIRLKENNTISIVYDSYTIGTPTSASPQVGLRGASNSDFNNRLSSGTSTSNWASSTAGTSNSNSMTLNTTSLPTAGLTYTWTPGQNCIAPPAQPSALNLTYAGTTVNGTFTPVADADTYLVVRTANGITPDMPEDGVSYTTGTGLGGTIVAVTATPSFSSSSLAGNTTYTYTVFAVNRICTNGPLYNLIDPLTADVTSCPSVPTSLTSGNATQTTFELNWIAPAGGTDNEFEYSVEISTDNTFATQIQGSPFTVSSDETNLYVDNLQNSTKYYYRIAAKNTCQGAYSSVGSISTSCIALTTLPYAENFNEASIPSCWSTGLVSGTNNWATGSYNDGVPSAKSGTYFASKTYSNSDALFISPEFDMTAQTAELRIKVWIYRNDEDGDPSDVVKFHVSNTNTLTDSAELLSVGLNITQSPVVTTGGWKEYTATIPSEYKNAPFYIIAEGITAGSYNSYGLGFDDFLLEQIPTSQPVSAQVATIDNAAATIDVNDGTLQLKAIITPADASQTVTWSLINGTGTATISETGLVTAVSNGTVTAKAVSVENNTISSELVITITNQVNVLCTPAFSNGVEAITLVEFGGFSNPSPATEAIAYENFTTITGIVEQGATAAIRLKGNTAGNFTTYFTAYFDWNNNNIFEDTEKTDLGSITQSTGADAIELTSNITVPATATLGNIRMRVLKRFASSVISVTPCNTAGYGQAEDYTINVVEAGLATIDFNKTKFTVYPNPTTGKVTIDTQSEINSVSIYNQLGQLLSNTANKQIDLSAQPSGIYIIHMDFTDGKTATSKIIKQ